MLSLPRHAPEWHMREAPRRWAGEAIFAAGCRAFGIKFYKAVSPSRRTICPVKAIQDNFSLSPCICIIAFIAGECREKVHIHALTKLEEPSMMLPICPHLKVLRRPLKTMSPRKGGPTHY